MRIMMKRSFEHRVSIAEIAGAVVLAMVAFWFLWHNNPMNIIIGCLFCLVAVFAIDRLLHTTYIVTDEKLIVEHGRFSRKKEIKLSDIDRVEKVKTLFTHYVLVEHSGSKHVTISTTNEDALIKALNSKTLSIK